MRVGQPRALLRWLCRPLTEATFLRRILAGAGGNPADAEPAPFTLAYAFQRLDADAERPEELRQRAYAMLADALAADTATGCFAITMRVARSWPEKQELADVAAYSALPELFPAPPARVAYAEGFHEVHAHLRGSIPWESMWVGWLTDERWRGRLRARVSQCDGWERTHAELVERAAALRDLLDVERRPTLSPVSPGSAEEERAWWVRLAKFVLYGSPSSDVRVDRAVMYLAILTHLRHAALFRRGGARGEVGLAPFVRSYGAYALLQKRRRHDRGELRSQVGEILDRFARDGVVAVELRPTFEDTPGALRQRLLTLVRGYLEWLAGSPAHQVALGLVVSLHKGDRLPSKHASQLEPAELVEVGAGRADWWAEQVRALTEILEDEPILRWFVVGLDAAGAERGCPIRSLTPAYSVLDRYHRRHGARAIRPGVGLPLDRFRQCRGDLDRLNEALSRDLDPGWPRLGKTIHAGEDFVDPLTGLRHIDEALDTLRLGWGDRIGHAIAAALDPSAVRELLGRRALAPDVSGVREVGRDRWVVRVPRGERLLDLAWAAARLGLDGGIQRATLREVATRTWVGAESVLCRGLAEVEPRPGLPGLHYGAAGVPLALVVEEVELGPADLAVREQLRQLVLARFVRAEVTVESCPTSNVTVADLSRPPLRAFERVDGLGVVVATDDPGLFGSYPAAELQRWVPPGRRQEVIRATERASWVRRA